MNKALKTLTLALALTSLVMALGSQIPSILPMSPVTEPIIFEKDATVQGIFGLSANSRNLKTWWDYCEFLKGGSNIYLTLASGTGAALTIAAPGSLRVGVLSLSTGTTNSGYSVLYAANTSFQFSGGVYTYEVDVRLPVLSDGTNTYVARIGFGDAQTGGTPIDGAYFYYTDIGGGGATPNWYRNTVSNTTLTSTDTGVAVTTDWTRMKAVVNADGTSVEYFIDGVSVGTNTTNIPATAGRECGIVVSITKTAGTTARLFYIDWAWLHVDLTTGR